jgi:hypothetical protein
MCELRTHATSRTVKKLLVFLVLQMILVHVLRNESGSLLLMLKGTFFGLSVPSLVAVLATISSNSWNTFLCLQEAPLLSVVPFLFLRSNESTSHRNVALHG